MGKTANLGRRIELLSMDPHCDNISIGLYEQKIDGSPRYLIHSYFESARAAERIAFIREAIVRLLGLQPVAESPDWLEFPCKSIHVRALRRAFLDVCKLNTGEPLVPKPLKVDDKKAGCEITVTPVADGAYDVQAEQGAENGPKRAKAIARGLVKLCEMQVVEGHENRVAFACKSNHDELIGALLVRAQNVRAAIQEEEMSASRGILSAPSAQN